MNRQGKFRTIMFRLILLFTIIIILIITSCASPSEAQETVQCVTIGSSGGIIEVNESQNPISGVQINIPEGALKENEEIALSKGVEVEDPDLISIPVLCEPEGLQFDKDVLITVPLKKPYPEDGLVMVLVYDHEQEAYTFAGQLIESKEGATTLSFEIDHFSSFILIGLADYFAKLQSVIKLADAIVDLKNAIETDDLSELQSIKQKLTIQQDEYYDQMYSYVEKQGWCSKTFGFDSYLKKAEDAIYEVVTSKGLAVILGVSKVMAVKVVSTICLIPSLIYWGAADICFLSTSWLNPGYLEAQAGWWICEYLLRQAESAESDMSPDDSISAPTSNPTTPEPSMLSLSPMRTSWAGSFPSPRSSGSKVDAQGRHCQLRPADAKLAATTCPQARARLCARIHPSSH